MRNRCVNLFVPSQVTWNWDGTEVSVEQETDYPESDTAMLTIRPAKKTAFSLRFRVPGWCQGAGAEVNGARQAVVAKPGGWATIAREWNPGDRVTIHIPMRLALAPIDTQHPNRVALTYGPVVLVRRHQSQLSPMGPKPEGWIQPSGARLEFRVSPQAQPASFFEPFYRVAPDTGYAMYFDLQT